MGKKIAVINDLSGFGKCSLTAAIPVISVMGVQACPMPTAVLSSQTGYPSYCCYDFTDKMDNIRSEWEKLNVEFDGIYTGYVADEKQILNILKFLDTFKKQNTFLLTDPVMADNGKVYSMFNENLLELMKILIRRADIITPNLTELTLLCKESYERLIEQKNKETFIEKIKEMALKLLDEGTKNVIVTGIPVENPDKDRIDIGNLLINKSETYLSVNPYKGESYSGTGDIFASVISAGVADGRGIKESIDMAGKFIQCSIADTCSETTDANDGIEFEKHLGMLIRKQVK